jgi:hypothetical protein
VNYSSHSSDPATNPEPPMSDTPKTERPEYTVTPVEPPRLLCTILILIATALGVLLVWAQSIHPFTGVPLDHPVCLLFIAVIVLGGIGSAIGFWVSPAEQWRKVPTGPLSPAVRELADAGKKREAVEQLRKETGAGLYEASRVVEDYLARQV